MTKTIWHKQHHFYWWRYHKKYLAYKKITQRQFITKQNGYRPSFFLVLLQICQNWISFSQLAIYMTAVLKGKINERHKDDSSKKKKKKKKSMTPRRWLMTIDIPQATHTKWSMFNHCCYIRQNGFDMFKKDSMLSWCIIHDMDRDRAT